MMTSSLFCTHLCGREKLDSYNICTNLGPFLRLFSNIGRHQYDVIAFLLHNNTSKSFLIMKKKRIMEGNIFIEVNSVLDVKLVRTTN